MNKILDLGDIQLILNNNTYYIRRDSDDVLFDLGDNWKSDRKNRYMTDSTKKHLVQMIEKQHINVEGVRDFITWYNDKYGGTENVTMLDNNNKSNKSISNDTKSVSVDFSQTNKLLEDLKNEIKLQNNFVKTNILEVLADKILQVKAEQIVDRLTDSVDKYINNTYGVLPQKYEFILPNSEVKTETGIFHKELPNVMKFIQADIPLLLTGPAGSGKNFTLEKAASLLDLDFYFTNAVTQEYKLTGFIDANGVYQETQFYKAFKNGGVFFLDEMDASIPEALIILNAAIANRYFDFPNGRIEAHENFRVVAAANTYGTGSDIVYCGRNVLDGATLDRFAVLEFNYDENVEKDKCPNKELYEFCISLRKAINNKHLRYIVSIRAMSHAYKMTKLGFDKKYIIKTAITKSMTEDDINNIKDDLIKNEWTEALFDLYKVF